MTIGDFNAKIGKGYDENIVGTIGLGHRNKRGRLYTWKSPVDTPENVIRNPIDLILITRDSADIYSDQNLQVCRFQVKLHPENRL